MTNTSLGRGAKAATPPLDFEGKPIAYTLVRSSRKTVGLYVTAEARLEVRAPLGLPRAQIDRIVASKAQWIRERLGECRQRLAARASFSVGYGDTLFLCGKPYPLRPAPGNRAGFDGQGFFLPPGLEPPEIKSLLVNLYKDAARQILAGKAARYAEIMGVRPAAVKINSARRRWGSCSAASALNFTWRLVMADHAVIDYLVVHELAHLREPNHSPRFWAIVRDTLPDADRRKQALKAFEKRLALEAWD